MYSLLFKSLYHEYLHKSSGHQSASLQLLTNGYTEPHSGHGTWSIPHAVGLCFHLFSVLLIIECVTYFYAKIRIFWKPKMSLQRKKKQRDITPILPYDRCVSTITPSSVPKGVVVESFNCNRLLTLRPAILMCFCSLYNWRQSFIKFFSNLLSS